MYTSLRTLVGDTSREEFERKEIPSWGNSAEFARRYLEILSKDIIRNSPIHTLMAAIRFLLNNENYAVRFGSTVVLTFVAMKSDRPFEVMDLTYHVAQNEDADRIDLCLSIPREISPSKEISTNLFVNLSVRRALTKHCIETAWHHILWGTVENYIDERIKTGRYSVLNGAPEGLTKGYQILKEIVGPQASSLPPRHF